MRTSSLAALAIQPDDEGAQADARFQLRCCAGEIWAKRAGELDEAAVVIEEARAIKPCECAQLAARPAD